MPIRAKSFDDEVSGFRKQSGRLTQYHAEPPESNQAPVKNF
jgi:hypothetical protein